MTKTLEGIRVLEVSQWGYVPSAGAVLADWGADVIKVEHPEQGDPVRGLTIAGIAPGTKGFNFTYEQVGRGKRDVGIDIARAEGHELIMRLVENSDVFLTSFLPEARRKLRMDVEDVRARNPEIIYARGSGQGSMGPEAEKGGFDAISFWARSSIAFAITPEDLPYPLRMPAPAFGDILSGMTLAGGVAAAIAYRERTGMGTVVDGSLLATAMWAMSGSIVPSKLLDVENIAWPSPRDKPGNPLANAYRTSDGRFVILNILQGDRYWPEFCKALDRADLIDDPKVATASARQADVGFCVSLLSDIFATRTLEQWREALSQQGGQWDVIRTVREAYEDEQAWANGYLQDVDYGDGRSITLVSAPIQFDERPPDLRPAPELGAHTEEVLLEAGYSWDAIIDLKDAGAIS